MYCHCVADRVTMPCLGFGSVDDRETVLNNDEEFFISPDARAGRYIGSQFFKNSC